jgi:hypothetical protein
MSLERHNWNRGQQVNVRLYLNHAVVDPMGSRNNEELVVSHLLFANDTLIFVMQTPNKFDICDVFSYVLKQFQG